MLWCFGPPDPIFVRESKRNTRLVILAPNRYRYEFFNYENGEKSVLGEHHVELSSLIGSERASIGEIIKVRRNSKESFVLT